MRQIYVTVRWQSEHLVELDEEVDVANLVQALASQSNVKLIDYTVQPLDEAVDAAVDRLLSPGQGAADPLS